MSMLWLRRLSWLEGGTLLALVGIAVPLKYLAGMPAPVALIGPVHGAVFLAFLALLAASTRSVAWTPEELIRLTLGACLPLGAFVNAGLLRRKALEVSI
jgi:integral membrane protein